MAKMFPARVFTHTESPGEIEIFNKLRKDPITDDWVVLHSLDIANHRRQISGEIDFVVIVPNKGVLCLEVKACKTIRRDSGLWYLGTKPPEKRGPFKQAAQAMQSIKKHVWDKDRTLKKIVFWSAVIFPYVSFDLESPEWHHWQVVDTNKYRKMSIGEIILEILDYARNHLENTPSAKWFTPTSNEPRMSQLSTLVEILRQNFEFFESAVSRAKRRQEELKFYTVEQYDALDAMEENSRVIFSGPAGTGKTLLALELARRKSNLAKSVLLLCFNRLLGEWLEEETQLLKPHVKSATIHSYMLSLAGISPDKDDSAFWQKMLPKYALESISQLSSGEHLFDVIIIDEAQDILTDENLAFINAILRGGLSAGGLYLFGDFERQVIYKGNPKEIIQSKLSSIPKFSLRINCRNTPRIAEFVHILGKLKPRYSRIRRPDNQIEPEIILYENKDDQQEKLINMLDNFTKQERYVGKEIILLSPLSDHNCCASALLNNKGTTIKPIYSLTSEKQIGFCSIYAFKGLEAPVIILTDIEEVLTEQAMSLFYTAVTRALDRITIFVNTSVREDLLGAISPNTKEG